MYIVDVIPLIKILRPNPQILTYFSANAIKSGGLVKISLRNKKINALVFNCQKMEQKTKIQLKKFTDFQIKPVEKIVSFKPVITEKQMKLLFWIAEYYFAPLGIVAKIFLAKHFSVEDKKFKIKKLIITPKNKSLIFAPFKNLKSIIIEDESNELYQSWGRKPYYNVKNIATELAKIHRAKLIFKTTLPSIESYYYSRSSHKKYELEIEKSKIDSQSKIESFLVDMREELKRGNSSIISLELQEKIKKSEKSILYISRRGTNTFILCRECGYVAMCKNCDVPLVYHADKAKMKLVCHHCGREEIAPVICPNCKSIKIKYFGAGTQKVETEIKRLFPEKNTFRLDSDISSDFNTQQQIIRGFQNSKNAVLVGAQMLFGKNLNADLGAIVSVETILNLPDFYSAERVFQIINKIRNMSQKTFLIQSYNPESPAIVNALANNFAEFYNNEIKARRTFGYPPFSQIIKLQFAHKNPENARNEAKIIFEKIKTQKNNLKITDEQLEILGPVPAFIPRKNGLYHWNIVLKSKIKDVQLRNRLLVTIPPKWEIIIDPQTLL